MFFFCIVGAIFTFEGNFRPERFAQSHLIGVTSEGASDIVAGAGRQAQDEAGIVDEAPCAVRRES